MMKFRILLVMATLCMVFGALSAHAHEHQVFKIGSKQYEFTVGSLGEPVYIDDKSGVELQVMLIEDSTAEAEHHEEEQAGHEHEDASKKPVIGLENALKVEISAGNKKATMELKPTWGEEGAYYATFYPTVATTYTYRVFGTLNKIAVDLSFSCNPQGHAGSEEDTQSVQISKDVVRVSKAGSFGCPSPRDEVYFPERAAPLLELSKGSEQGKQAFVTASQSASTSNIGMTIAIGALLLALLSFVLALVAWKKKK